MSRAVTEPGPQGGSSDSVRRRTSCMLSPQSVALSYPSFRPFMLGGLWLPVIMTAPFRSR